MEILAFTGENFAEALKNEYTQVEAIKSKKHFDYFLRYLGNEGLNAQYMVVERDYISKDFLHDYASYYALCFKNYPKFCKRIHFFNTTLTEELFEKVLLNKLDSPVNIWDSYLGFIVVKPIPTAIIGYTVLRNYNFNENIPDRHFWGLRPYKVHIFGHELEVKSLAFQEQDSVLAACATTAIWSMLNKAAADFHTTLKSPSQITRDADNVSPDGSRLFPNRGLSVSQICQAIFNSGLVSEVMQPDMIIKDEDGDDIGYVSNTYTKKIISAYSGIGIPIILVIRVPDEDDHGYHAITVLGHKQIPVTALEPTTEISWLANNVEKLYAHDDQFGPFVKVFFRNELDLETPWSEQHPDRLPTRVTNIIVPVYPKVRISYQDIEAIVIGIDAILTLFFNKKIRFDLVWDIKISLSESFKEDVISSSLDDTAKMSLLTESLPKYLWIATCYSGTFKIFVFTFDATDVINGMIAQDLICYLPETDRKTLCEFLVKNRSMLEKTYTSNASLNYYNFLLKKLA